MKILTAMIISLSLTAAVFCVISYAQETGMETVSVNAADTEDHDRVSDDITEKVLSSLDNVIYSFTLEALQKGEIVEYGSSGMTVEGVQRTLADFGCDIVIDGKADEMTFTALNSILDAFGMDESNTVDAELYTELLPFLLLSTAREDTAYEVLKDYFTPDENSGGFYYMRGCALYLKGLYYSAYEAFEKSMYKDYEYRAESCVQPRPEDGEMWHNSSMESEDLRLIFRVNDTEPTIGVYFEIYTDDGILVSEVFLNGSSSTFISLPAGKYRFKDAYGEKWYGTKEVFGRPGSYEDMYFDRKSEDGFIVNLEAGYEYTIDIYFREVDTTTGRVPVDWENWRQ